MPKRERDEGRPVGSNRVKNPPVPHLYDWTKEGGKVAKECGAPWNRINLDSDNQALKDAAYGVIDRLYKFRIDQRSKPTKDRKDPTLNLDDAIAVAEALRDTTQMAGTLDRSKVRIIGDGTYGIVFSVPVNGSAVAMKMQYCAKYVDLEDAEHGLEVAKALRDCHLVEFKAKAFRKTLTGSIDGKKRTWLAGGLVLTFMPVLKSVNSFCQWGTGFGTPTAVFEQANRFADFLESICACLDRERAVFPDMKLANIAYCEKQAAFRLIDLDGLVGFSEDKPGEQKGLAATYPVGTSQPGAFEMWETWGYRNYTYEEGKLQTRYACAVTALLFTDPREAAFRPFLYEELDSDSSSFENRTEILRTRAAKMQKTGGLEELGKFIASVVETADLETMDFGLGL